MFKKLHIVTHWTVKIRKYTSFPSTTPFDRSGLLKFTKPRGRTCQPTPTSALSTQGFKIMRGSNHPQTSHPESSAVPGGDSKVVPSSPNNFHIEEKVGAIFEAPENTIIIHACNCLGSWSAGIAAAFKQRYPNAYEVYREHCENNTPASLIGTSLLIPPVERKGPRHFIGCLFTSKKFGRGKDSPAQILGQTGPAMKDLVSAITRLPEGEGGIEEIRMCQINSGLFSVPWERSKAVIESLELSDRDFTKIPREVIVYSLPKAPAK